jgi:hypothetical protein
MYQFKIILTRTKLSFLKEHLDLHVLRAMKYHNTMKLLNESYTYSYVMMAPYGLNMS